MTWSFLWVCFFFNLFTFVNAIHDRDPWWVKAIFGVGTLSGLIAALA